MKIKYLGHAAFLLTSDSGVRIITDPYHTGGDLHYGEIREAADIVTMSHSHGDHNNKEAVKGNPKVLTSGDAEIKGIKISSIPSYHDNINGRRAGNNNIFCFDIDSLRVCHLGDLGHPPGDQQVSALGKVDVLIVPVGGFYTIDAATASAVIDRVKPAIAIPMHFQTAKSDYPITGVVVFIRGKKNVRQTGSSELDVKASNLPTSTEIVVLEPAL